MWWRPPCHVSLGVPNTNNPHKRLLLERLERRRSEAPLTGQKTHPQNPISYLALCVSPPPQRRSAATDGFFQRGKC